MTIISPLYEQNPPPNESIAVIVRKKKKSSANFVSLRCNRHHFSISSLSFLPCHLFHFFIQWIFGPNHCQWFHFSIKLGDAVSLFCQLKAFFLSHGQWRCHCYYLVFSTFVTFFLTSSLLPSIPSFPRQDCFSTFCCSFLCFVTVFSGRHKTPRWVVNKNNSQHRHQLKCK